MGKPGEETRTELEGRAIRRLFVQYLGLTEYKYRGLDDYLSKHSK